MATSLVDIIANRKNPTLLSNIALDATVSVTHKYVNKKTSYPVETKNDISDHVRQLPETVTIVGHFTSHPLRILEGQIPLNEDRIDLAHTELLKLAGRVAPKQLGEAPVRTITPPIIDIVVGLRIYTQMMITELDIKEEKNTKNSLQFTIKAEAFETATTEITVVNNTSDLEGKAPFIRDQGQKKVQGGVKNTGEVDEGTLLFQSSNSLKALFRPDAPTILPTGATP